MTGKPLLGLLALAAVAPAVCAEQVYVIEQLIVAVASDPSGSGERVAQVKSGEQLELLERQGSESHVRLANGKDGWVKSSYLSGEQPLQFRLNERTAEVDKLKQAVNRLESELASAHAVNTSAPQPTTPPPQPAPGPPPREAVLLTDLQAYGHAPWPWILGTAALMLLAGFGLGWRSLDRRIRRKYGGLRIY